MPDPPNTNNPPGTGAAMNDNEMEGNRSRSSSATPRASPNLAATNNAADANAGASSDQISNIQLTHVAAPIADTSGPMGRAKFVGFNQNEVVYLEPSDWDIARAEYHENREILHRQRTIREKFEAFIATEDLTGWNKLPRVKIVVGHGDTARKINVDCPLKLFNRACPKADRYTEVHADGSETVELPDDIRDDLAVKVIHSIAHGEDIVPPDNVLDLTVPDIIQYFRIFVYLNLHREAKLWEDTLLYYFSEYKLPLITSEVALVWKNFRESDTVVDIMLAHLALAKRRGQMIDEADLLRFARVNPFFAMALSNAFKQGDRITDRAVSVADVWRETEGLDHPSRGRGSSTRNYAAPKRSEEKDQKKKSRSERYNAVASSSSAPPNRPLLDLPTSDCDDEQAELRKTHANLIQDPEWFQRKPPTLGSQPSYHKRSAEAGPSTNRAEAMSEAQRFHDSRVRRRFQRLSLTTSEDDQAPSGLTYGNRASAAQGVTTESATGILSPVRSSSHRSSSGQQGTVTGADEADTDSSTGTVVASTDDKGKKRGKKKIWWHL